MANRRFQQFQMSLEKRQVSIFAHVTFGASGAPTLDVSNSKGVVSVTRNSAGVYTFVFGTDSQHLDPFVKLLSVKKVFMSASGTPDREMVIRANNISNVSLASIQIEFDVETVATDPANGSEVFMEFVFGDSTAP